MNAPLRIAAVSAIAIGLLAASVPALAQVRDAPEISASTLPAALGLLGAGMLMLRARWPRK